MKRSFTNNLKLNNAIEFIMAKIPNNVKLYYAFKGNKYGKRIQPSCISGKCYFKIPFTENKNRELLILANKQRALQHKITLKKYFYPHFECPQLLQIKHPSL